MIFSQAPLVTIGIECITRHDDMVEEDNVERRPGRTDTLGYAVVLSRRSIVPGGMIVHDNDACAFIAQYPTEQQRDINDST